MDHVICFDQNDPRIMYTKVYTPVESDASDTDETIDPNENTDIKIITCEVPKVPIQRPHIKHEYFRTTESRYQLSICCLLIIIVIIMVVALLFLIYRNSLKN
jgi:hypothetical protein